jgi:hypothetical protein
MTPPVVGGIEVYFRKCVFDTKYIVPYVVVVNGWIDKVFTPGSSFNCDGAGFCYVVACNRYGLMASKIEFYGGTVVRESIAADYRRIIRLLIVVEIHSSWVAVMEVDAFSVAVERIVGNGCAAPSSRDASGIRCYVVMVNGDVNSGIISGNTIINASFNVIVRDEYIGYAFARTLDINVRFFGFFHGEPVNDYIGVLDTDQGICTGFIRVPRLRLPTNY